MSPKIGFLLASLGTALALFIFALREHAAARKFSAAIASADEQRKALIADVDRAQRETETLSTVQNELEAELERLRTSPRELASTRAEKTTATSAPRSVHDALLNDPKFQNLALAARRASLSATYGPLFETLHLSTEQIEKFKDAVLAHEENRMDSAAIRDIRALPANDATMENFNAQSATELERVQRELLGESGFRQLKDYERSLPARKAVDTFAGNAALAGVPLTSAQAEQLTQIIAQTSQEFREGGPVKTIDWKAALESAAAVLTQHQADLIRQTTLPEQYLQRIQILAEQPIGSASANEASKN